MAPAVRLRSAVALLGGFPVLAGADLDVQPGEVVLLQGANGAGKTSLLRTCAGLLLVVSGTAEVLGCDLTVDRRAVRRRVGLMGHATSLYDDLTVEDNVRFAVRAAGAASKAVEPALVRLGLAGRLRSVPVGRLSAGQRRRTGLAILVARQPELWLLDEPHAGLDAEHRDLLDELIRHAVANGAAVLLASHERDRASALAHRTLTMAGGVVVPAGQPSALSGQPVAGSGGQLVTGSADVPVAGVPVAGVTVVGSAGVPVAGSAGSAGVPVAGSAGVPVARSDASPEPGGDSGISAGSAVMAGGSIGVPALSRAAGESGPAGISPPREVARVA